MTDEPRQAVGIICPHEIIGEHGGDELLQPCPGLKETTWCSAHESPWYDNEGLCLRAAAAVAWNEDDEMQKDCEMDTWLIVGSREAIGEWRTDPEKRGD